MFGQSVVSNAIADAPSDFVVLMCIMLMDKLNSRSNKPFENLVCQPPNLAYAIDLNLVTANLEGHPLITGNICQSDQYMYWSLVSTTFMRLVAYFMNDDLICDLENLVHLFIDISQVMIFRIPCKEI